MTRIFLRLFVSLVLLLALHMLATHTVFPQGQAITIDTPTAGTLVGSPMVVTGSTATYPNGGRLVFRVLSNQGADLGTGPVTVFGSPGQAGRINATIPFTLPPGVGNIRLELFDLDAAGNALGYAGVDLRIAQFANEQSIVIDQPKPGDRASGSVTVSGRTTRYPEQGSLEYGVVGEGDATIGSGTLPVQGSPNGPGTFSGQVGFTPPTQGGQVRIVVYQRDPETGGFVGYSAVDLQVPPVEPPMQIFIDTPSNGAVIGSPVQLIGRTTRLPRRGFLSSQALNAAGNEIGVGIVAVNATAGGGGTFNLPFTLNLPPGGGPVRIILSDRDAVGNLIAQAEADVQVASRPPVQPTPVPIAAPALIIESPPQGTLVGSPVTITGRMTRYPRVGSLHYRFFDGAGNLLGEGNFGVVADPSGASFVVSLTFNLPPQGGVVRFELYERDQAYNILSSASLSLTTSPSETAQIITIDTPGQEAEVGSPVTITGRTTRYPRDGNLNYRFTDASNNNLGSGTFLASNTPGEPANFNVSLQFRPLSGGGYIRLEVWDLNQANGVIANSFLTLRVNPDPGEFIVNRSWRLFTLQEPGGSSERINTSRVTVSYYDNESLRGRGECTTYNGGYRFDGDRIMMNYLDIGTRGCSRSDVDINQEVRIGNALRDANRFSANGDRLEVYFRDGGVLTFFAE